MFKGVQFDRKLAKRPPRSHINPGAVSGRYRDVQRVHEQCRLSLRERTPFRGAKGDKTVDLFPDGALPHQVRPAPSGAACNRLAGRIGGVPVFGARLAGTASWDKGRPGKGLRLSGLMCGRPPRRHGLRSGLALASFRATIPVPRPLQIGGVKRGWRASIVRRKKEHRG